MHHEREHTILASFRRDFGKDFSGSAFKIDRNGEAAIMGRLGQITQHPCSTYDAYFGGPDKPLGTRKLNNLAREMPEEWRFRQVDGEGWVQGRGREFVLVAASLLGVRRKRTVSEKERTRLAEQLRRAA